VLLSSGGNFTVWRLIYEHFFIAYSSGKDARLTIAAKNKTGSGD
jgi:hypothetical protein